MENSSKKNLKSNFRCGDCFHYKVKAHNQKESVCSNLAVRATAVAPRCFTPDVTQIVRNSDQMLAVANLFHNFTPKQRRILLSFLQQNSKKFAFGTKVYFLAVGKDYLSNYLSGYVVGLDSNKDIIVTGDPDRNKQGRGYTATFLDDSSLLTQEEFQAKKEWLIENDLISDPKKPLVELPKAKVEYDYEPPTLERFNADPRMDASKKKRKGRVKELTDTITIV